MIRFWLVSVLLLFAPSFCIAAERFVAMFADGTRTEEAEIREWNEPNSQPKIGGRALFDPGAPVRWIIDRQQMTNVKPATYLPFLS